MLAINCAHCGVINQAAEPSCVSCGSDLALQSSFAAQKLTSEWEPQIDPDQPLPGIAPFAVDTALSETFSLFGRNFWLITKIVVVTVAPFELFRAFNAPEITDQLELTAWSVLLNGACKVLVVPALIYALVKTILTGAEPGVHESYRWGLTKFWKIAICVFIIGVLQAFGYALLIIPGIIVSLVFVLVLPVAVLENGSVTEAFARSIDLTRGHRFRILWVGIVVGVILLIVSALGSFIMETSPAWLAIAGLRIIGDILDQLVTIMSLVMYLSLPRQQPSGNQSVLSLK